MSPKKEEKKEIAKLPVYTKKGKKSGEEVELHPAIFSARVNQRLLQIVLTGYAANQRRGTADTKERKEVRGGGRKPWRQKGTGRARAGSIRSPLWRGGGTTFGPQPRDYSVHLPEELRRKALISALSLKLKEEHVMIVEDTHLDQPKTKELVGVVKALKLDGNRTLCIVGDIDEKLKRASGNLTEIFALRRAEDVNAYHIMRRKKLLIDRQALPLMEKRILGVSDASGDQNPPRKSKEKVGV